jgi:outer membrane receptor protein involved in Fe transport
VSQAPANFSAHRFLADAYAPLPRYEIARVSELLQSQLLQPVSAVPLPPRLGETRAPVLYGEGPITPSFHEFNPLFGPKRYSLFVSATSGNRGTLGDELMYAEVHDNQALRLGQFHHETDGWRENSDFKQDIYSLFYQSDLAWHTSIQAEYRTNTIDNGDLRQRLEPEVFSTSLRQRSELETSRIGLRHSESASAHWLLSLIQTREERRERGTILSPPDPIFGTLRQDTDSRIDTADTRGEIQHLRQMDLLHLTAGAGNSRVSKRSENVDIISASGGIFPFPPQTEISGSDDRQRHKIAYAYLLWPVAPQVTLTTGLSYDEYVDPAIFSRDQWNPKLGLLWNISSHTRLRFAAFRTLKRPLAANQTLEPTQVAGINQFFDDVNGTDAKNRGVGIEQRLAHGWFLGAELAARDLDVPVGLLGGGLDRIEPRSDRLFRGYLSGSPTSRLSVSAEFAYEDEERTPSGPSTQFATRVTSRMLPLRGVYHHPGGAFTRVRVTPVEQSVERLTSSGTTEASTRFTLVDFSFGYRLPGRDGSISLGVQNLFDRRFGFEDADLSGNPRLPMFQPGRSVFLRLALYP